MAKWQCCVFLVAACNSRVRPESQVVRSAEYESCASTSDCQSNLRCVEQSCRAVAGDLVAEYFVALGERARTDGQFDDAVTAFEAALSRYKERGGAVPLLAQCSYGHALAGATSKPENAELAAAALHACASAAAPGSRFRSDALMQLAGYQRAGLQADRLGQTPGGQRYLTAPVAPPVAAKPVVTITSDVASKEASYAAFVEKLQNEGSAGFLSCFEAYQKDGKERSLEASFQVAHRFVQAEYQEDDGYRLTLKELPVPGQVGPAAVANDCVTAVAQAVAKKFRAASGSWQGKLSIRYGLQ